MTSTGIFAASVALNSARISAMKTDSVALYHQRFGRINRVVDDNSLCACDGAIPDCDDPDAEPIFATCPCGTNGCDFHGVSLEGSDLAEAGMIGEPGVVGIRSCSPSALSKAIALGVCAVELEPGDVYQPIAIYTKGVLGASHSINDGFRDTLWRRANRAVKRWFRGAARQLKGCVYCGIDEVGHFMLKVIGAGLTLYAVAVLAVHFYG